MRAPRSLLLLIGGTALVAGAVVALRVESAVAVVGGIALALFGTVCLAVWFRQSWLNVSDDGP